jgi:hypothetical protein
MAQGLHIERAIIQRWRWAYLQKSPLVLPGIDDVG